MKKNLKISKKTYETVFSFKIEGTMADPIIPTPPPPQPHPPPFPPLNPFPSGPGYPGYPGYPPSPLGPIPPVGNYVGQRPWRQLVYRFARDYAWNQWLPVYGWTVGEDAIAKFNNFKANGGWWGQDPADPNYGNSTGVSIPCNYSFSIPDDRTTEETVLGMYPTDEPIPNPYVNRFVFIASFDHHYSCGEHIDMGETGLQGGNYSPSFVARGDNFQLFFTGETVYG